MTLARLLFKNPQTPDRLIASVQLKNIKAHAPIWHLGFKGLFLLRNGGLSALPPRQ